jgi:hypothetical protein
MPDAVPVTDFRRGPVARYVKSHFFIQDSYCWNPCSVFYVEESLNIRLNLTVKNIVQFFLCDLVILSDLFSLTVKTKRLPQQVPQQKLLSLTTV